MTFAEIVGQTFIKQRLTYIARQEKIPHALLFTGPEGVGKLATAIAFAQYINCHKPHNDDSCNTCSSCHKYNHLIHPDLHFVFPIYKGNKTSAVCDDFINDWRDFVLTRPYFKSSDWYQIVAEDKGQPIIYADESLEIINKLSVKNYEAKYKVIVIYQPERMHTATANKILKVLEEPPAYTVFILISSNPELLLPTIVSRCQIVKFPLLDDVSISQYLKEKYPQHKEHEIHQAVILAGGSLPHAIQALENQNATQEFFNWYVQIFRLAFEVARNKPRRDEMIKWASTLAGLSKEQQKDFILYALRFTRDHFLNQASLKSLTFLTKEEQDFSEKFARFITFPTAQALYKYFSDALYHLERNGNAKIIFTDLAFLLTRHF
ncbi:MAG: DNA polymerase III subunit delta' [Bacteroidales bacterium]|nr:DNA polymerase III subunit delta' [Bacteroidales bacterium]